MRLGSIIGILAALLLSATSARADEVTLRTGDVLHGHVLEDADGMILEHEVLGQVRLAHGDVASVRQDEPVVTLALPVPADPPSGVSAPVLARVPAIEITASQPLHGAASDKGPWSHSIEVSANTASGNTDVFNLEFDAESRYEQGVWAFEVGGHALYTHSAGDTTAQHYHANVRVERKLDSRTYVFGQVLFDRDELADLEYRVNGTIGIGRVLAKTKVAELRGEIGAGVTHEKRLGMESSTDPSGWLALDYERTWADNSKLTAEFDFLPNFGDFDLSVASLDIEYARAVNELMSLVFGLRLEYVINPPAAKSLDTYFTAGIRLSL